MKKVIYLFITFFLFFFFAGLNTDIKAQQKEKIVKGEVIDIYTFVKTGKSGVQSKDVMLESSKKGNPLGILSSGKIYLVIPEDPNVKTNEILTPFLCQKIVAKGKIAVKNGISLIFLSNIDQDMKAK
jgi:hypothetical protein